MKRIIPTSLALLAAVSAAAAASGGSAPAGAKPASAGRTAAAVVPLKDAKLNIEHNATDDDTGFQGFIDSEGWKQLDVRGPGGRVLEFEASRALGRLGVTELFFETVEPASSETPIGQVLNALPAGNYTIAGPGQENGKRTGPTSGTALLTHDIPAGPELVSPAGAVVPVRGAVARWKPVSKTITGKPVKIISYQLIIEKDVEPHPHMIGKLGLSMYLPPTVTQIDIPNGLLEPGTAYKWEVLAIEQSGNQTLSSGEFQTR